MWEDCVGVGGVRVQARCVHVRLFSQLVTVLLIMFYCLCSYDVLLFNRVLFIRQGISQALTISNQYGESELG